MIDGDMRRRRLTAADDEHECTFRYKGDFAAGEFLQTVGDPDNSEYRTSFGFDGDGVDMIEDVKKVEGRKRSAGTDGVPEEVKELYRKHRMAWDEVQRLQGDYGDVNARSREDHATYMRSHHEEEYRDYIRLQKISTRMLNLAMKKVRGVGVKGMAMTEAFRRLDDEWEKTGRVSNVRSAGMGKPKLFMQRVGDVISFFATFLNVGSMSATKANFKPLAKAIDMQKKRLVKLARMHHLKMSVTKHPYFGDRESFDGEKMVVAGQVKVGDDESEEMVLKSLKAAGFEESRMRMSARFREAGDCSCLMAMVDGPLADKLTAFRSLIAEDHLAADGLEEESHVTVKYGILSDDPEAVKKLLGGVGAPVMTLGQVTAFHNDEHVVLKVDVQSRALERLNRMVSEDLECMEGDFREYEPHLTLAYLRHDAGDPYYYERYFCGLFDGDEHEFGALTFSTSERKYHEIKMEA